MYADCDKYFKSEPENVWIQEEHFGIRGDHEQLKKALLEDCDGEPWPGRWFWVGKENFIKLCKKYGYEILAEDLDIDRTNPITHFKRVWLGALSSGRVTTLVNSS